MEKRTMKSIKLLLATLTVFVISLAVSTAILARSILVPLSDGTQILAEEDIPGSNNTLEVTVQYYIPPLDLRGYTLNHFEAAQWFFERINYHREQYGLHPYAFYTPAVVTSIEHSLDMRDNNFSRNTASDGRTHQQRHDRWMGYNRTKVTSSYNSTHMVEGALTPEQAHEMIDRILAQEIVHYFIMNPTYYYIGIGFSVQTNNTGRLSLTLASAPNQRAAHHARSPEERIAYRQQYLEMVREKNGWIP